MLRSTIFNILISNIWNYPTDTLRQIDVDSTWILHRYVEDQISTNFHVISTYFFDVISLIEKYTSFPRTFFGVISMVQKSTLFSLNFFDVTLIFEKSTLIARTFFDEISIARNPTSFLVKLQANEKVWAGFPLLVTLKNWLLQNFSPSTFQVNLPGVALSIKPWVLQPPTLQKNCRKFLGIYRTTTVPHNFWMATFL